MAKKKKAEEGSHMVLPGWFATWSDMVTLMFCFFVMLFAMSTLDVEKFQQVALSFSGRESMIMGAESGGRGIDDLIGSGIMDLPEIGEGVFYSRQGETEERNEAFEDMQKLISDFKTYFATQLDAGEVGYEETETSLTVRLEGGILFDSGRAEIKSEAFEILTMIADLAFGNPGTMLEVEGHTDNVPMRSQQFASNWELSNGRASSVLTYLVSNQGIDPRRITMRGFGEYHPIATNDTPEGRAINRRVEIRFVNPFFTR